MVVTFDCTTFLPLEAEAAFDLPSSIDANVGSMAESGERVVAAAAKGIAHGKFVTWQARLFGLTWTMQRDHGVGSPVPPRRWAGERSFHVVLAPEHVFTPLDYGTKLRDRVRFVASLGVLGSLAERVILGRYMPVRVDVRNEDLVATAGRMS